MKIYCNGDIIPRNNLREMFEPGFLFGWGAFETLRVYKGYIPFFDLHCYRLNKSLSLLGIDKVAIKEGIIKDLLSQNELEDAYVRINAYKKREGMGLLIYTAKFDYYPPSSYEKGASSVIYPQRFNTQALSWKVKSLSYLDKRIAWFYAQKNKKDEALITNGDGFIVGGARTNLFLVENKEKVLIPYEECGVFEGITKEIVKEIIKELGIEIKEEKITWEILFSSQEAFLTSSLMEVMPLVSCEERVIGKGIPGELTFRILSEYRKRLRKEK